MENNLFEKISKIENDDKGNQNNIQRKGNDEILKFEIRDTDPELVVFIKDIINKENRITKNQLYDTVGRSIGYNMIYSLSRENKPAISWERVRIWLDILGYDVEIVTRKKA